MALLGGLFVVYTHVYFAFILSPGTFCLSQHAPFYVAISDGALERAGIFWELFRWVVGGTDSGIYLS